MTLGVGIPTAPVLSMNPYGSTPDLYVTVSGGAGIGVEHPEGERQSALDRQPDQHPVLEGPADSVGPERG